MSKVLAYLVADHHAGGGYPARGIDDSDHAMEQITTLAVERKVPWLILLGDSVNNARSHADAPIPLRNRLQWAARQGVRVGYLDGNHDKRRVSWLNNPEFTHLDHWFLELGSHTWMGLDFRPRGEIQDQLAEIPSDVTGLFMHQGWGDLMHWQDAAQCDFAEVPEHVRLLATGDNHAECSIERHKNKGGGPLVVCSPGSTSVQSIVETGDKFIVALRDDEDRPFQPVRLKTRELVRVGPIRSEEEAEEFMATIGGVLEAAWSKAASNGLPDAMLKPLLQVSCTTELERFASRVEKAIGGKAHLFWKLTRPEKPETVFVPDLKESGGLAFTPMSMLPQEFHEDEDGREEAIALSQAMYACKDKADVQRTAKQWLLSQAGA